MGKNEELASMEMYPRLARLKRFIRRPLWTRIYNFTGKEWLGNNAPPLTDRTILKYDFHDDPSSWDGKAYSIVTYIEDGHEVGFGYHNEWKLLMNRKVFAKVVRNYIFIWAWHNWFGLRHWLYFKALHHVVERSIARNKKARDV